MEVLKDFGVNPVLLGAQIINFLIILFLLKRFLYKPVLDVLKKRESQISKSLEEAEKSRKILEETEEKEKRILKNARQKADVMLKNAKLQAASEISSSEEKARLQSEKIIQDAKDSIKQDTEKAEKELMKKVGLLAYGMIERSMANLLDKSQQRVLLEKAKQNLERNKNE